jgi:hypothetical protein
LADYLNGCLTSFASSIKMREENWATEEAIRRRDEVREGRVKTIPGDEALAQVLK